MTDKELNTGEPAGKVIIVEETYGHLHKKRRSKVVQWLQVVEEGSLLYSQEYVNQLQTYMVNQQGYVQKLLAEIEGLKKQFEPDMFWNADDPEQNHVSINDVVVEEYQNAFDMEVGYEIEIMQAIRLPNIKVRITAISNDGDLEWEIVNEITKE